MLMVLLRHLFPTGSEEELLRYLEGDLKDETIPGLDGVTGRWMMQSIGTEWGRDLIHEDLWIKVAEARIRDALESRTKVVVDDIRFPNEAAVVKELGGVMAYVFRPGMGGPPVLHVSDGLLGSYRFDETIINDSSLDVLKVRAERQLLGDRPTRKYLGEEHFV
ncbi:hypothetical protein [Pyruvatibacter mobilis]|nr:hypothetical protein [Pyruvatibacter mobilis]QJD74011.1 hypothetical protein HG718_00485 [Pyruvatibacter mobilis]